MKEIQGLEENTGPAAVNTREDTEIWEDKIMQVHKTSVLMIKDQLSCQTHGIYDIDYSTFDIH